MPSAVLRLLLACLPATLSMTVRLHGSQQSRTPLVNWYALEAGVPLEMVPPRPSNHPFDQVPFLTDGGVEVFESGACLLYLADAYGGADTPAQRAAFTKWVVWSNSELDGLCFGAVPGDHRVRGTSMDKPELRAVSTLDAILAENEWLVDGTFSVADVAVGSYLNYVPIFFPGADLSQTPGIAAYMQRCVRAAAPELDGASAAPSRSSGFESRGTLGMQAARPAFAQAFGAGHAALVAEKTAGWLANPAEPPASPADKFMKLFG